MWYNRYDSDGNMGIREDGHGGGGYAGWQGRRHQRCGTVDMEVCRGVRQRPAPAKRNTRNYGQYDRMMGMVSGIDSSTLETVAAGGDAVEM